MRCGTDSCGPKTRPRSWKSPLVAAGRSSGCALRKAASTPKPARIENRPRPVPNCSPGGCTDRGPLRYSESQSMIFSREYIGYLGRRTVKHLVDAKLITTSNLKATEERVTAALTDELSLEDRINEEVRVILDAYSEEMRKSGAQYAEMFK